jgi:hypothetical protein
MEGIIFRLAECLNETIAIAMNENIKTTDACLIRCVQLFHTIDALCDYFNIIIPEEAVSANIMLDDYFKQDILATSRKAYTDLVTELYVKGADQNENLQS